MTGEPEIKPLAGWKAALLIVGIASLVYFTTRQPGSRQTLGGPAPDFSLTDLADKKVNLADFKGKVVLLNFWATWCEPCQEEIPDLVALQKKYGPKGFTVLGVSLDSLGKKKVEPFVQKNGITYPVLLTEGDPPAGFDIPGMPTSFLVDRKGRLVDSYVGQRNESEFSRDIEAVLGD